MGLFRFLRRRRERERAISAEQLAALNQSGTQADPTIVDESIAAAIPAVTDTGRPGLPTTLLDAFRYAKLAKAAGPEDAVESDEQTAVGDSVLKAMRDHGIDPSSPDPARLMDPEVQRALRDAVLKHEDGGDG